MFNSTILESSFMEPMISGVAFPLFYIEFFVQCYYYKHCNNKVSPERVNGEFTHELLW